MKLRAFALAVALTATTPALAGSYTLDDVVRGAAIGLSEETLLRMTESPAAPWTVDGDTAVRLLRTGVSPAVVAALSAGEHPTPGEVARAREPGPKWGDAAPAAPPTASAAAGGQGAGGGALDAAGGSAEPVEAGGPGGAAPVADAAAWAAPAAVAAEAAGAEDDDDAWSERIHGDADPRLSSVHAGARTQANQAVAAGAGTAIAGVAVLAGTGIAGNGDNPGLATVGGTLAGIGGTSVLTGSLLAAKALRADGYRVSSAPGWVGVGMFGTGLLAYGGTWIVEGTDAPSTPGAVLVTGGVAMGLIQAAVNHGQRVRQLRAAHLDRADALPFPDDAAVATGPGADPALAWSTPATAGR